MTGEDDRQGVFTQEDHQVAFIFNPDAEAQQDRAPKRRRVSRQASKKDGTESSDRLFVPLLNGAEKPECVALRQQLFENGWSKIDGRIQTTLRNANSATLQQVSAFVSEANSACGEQIPAAFIITGPNIASQDLLFEQLSETLQRSALSKFVRLRSSDAATLKAALKKTIRDATARTFEHGGDDDGDEDDDALQVGQGQDGRRYLDYDLEALQAFTKSQKCDHVFVAFQDSEGFDSSLLSDLITLFNSWRPRIPFTLLFGIATSVDLLQARLLKSACRLIYGAQFDVVQTDTILESVFRGAVAASDVSLRLGAPLLRAMLDRQHDQVAGIQAFIKSVKYAYMCHFYANPLSVLLSSEAGEGTLLQPEHLEAIRNLPSFRFHVESSVDRGTAETLQHARTIIEDDEYLRDRVQVSPNYRQQWIDHHLRLLLVLESTGAMQSTFPRAYVDMMAMKPVQFTGSSGLVECIRRINIESLPSTLSRIISVFREGEASLHLGGATADGDVVLCASLEQQLAMLEKLKQEAELAGITLRSKYSGQNKVMRTTVIAQRVQLSRDSAALRDEDKQLTEIVDAVTELLTSHFEEDAIAGDLFLSESWIYDSRSPLRDIFVPRPRAVFERSLASPHDYLSCTCCTSINTADEDGPGLQATLPATSILYHMYLETGSLINVADLWSAFYSLVAEEAEEGVDERKVLAMFYRGLAELRALGFVKGSRRKADHIAKVRWL